MGIMDSIKDKAGDMMNDPEQRAKVEQMAKDKGISLEDAQKHLMHKDGQPT